MDWNIRASVIASKHFGYPCSTLRLAVAASTTNAAIQNKIFGSGMTALIFSNEVMDVIIKIIILLVESGLLIKAFSQTNKYEVKQKKGGFIGILLGALGANLLENLLTDK